ncbi:hypothetical protein RZS08_22065, partial [Arthrospira platensis SPKY1]|nr:hypothetical protein [Arthrospira platensis SPKY1]
LKHPPGRSHAAQILHLPCRTQLGQVRRRADGAAELLHQVAGTVDEMLGVDVQAAEQCGGVLGDGATFVLADAAACGFNEVQGRQTKCLSFSFLLVAIKL